MTSPEELTGAARDESSAVAGTTADETKAVAGTAKEQASAVASTTVQAATEVTDTAKEQATAVASEAKQQVGNVLDELREQASQQGEAQAQRAAGGLRTLADQLHGMATGKAPESGPAVDFVRKVADRLQALAGQLETQGPRGMLEQFRDFARRRPGGFLATAGLAGVAAGRLTRGATAGNSSDESSSTYRSAGTEFGTISDTTVGLPTDGYGTAAGTPLAGVAESDVLYEGIPEPAAYETVAEPLETEAIYYETRSDFESEPGYRSDPPGRI